MLAKEFHAIALAGPARCSDRTRQRGVPTLRSRHDRYD